MKLGNVATGDDFFDREIIREYIWQCLEGDHLVLRGVRRLGKSSVLIRLGEEAVEKGLLAAYKDVGGAKTADQFIAFLEDAIPDETVIGYLKNKTDIAKSWISRVKKVKVGVAGAGSAELELKDHSEYSWYKRAIAFQQRISDVPVIIQIDEFSVFLEKLIENDLEEADALLSWMRAWRVSSNTACRFIYTGSIGINYLLECHGLDTRLNDCHEVSLGPFKTKAAKEMITTQAKTLKWEISDKTIDCLIDKTGWLSPYFLNLLLDQSMLAARDRVEELELDERKINCADVEDGYERLVAERSRFIHWERRLSEKLMGADLAFCKDILTHIACAQTKGLTLRQINNRLSKRESDSDKCENKVTQLLNKLEDEGYLAPPDKEGRIIFLSFLLRDYWKRNHACK